MNEYDKFVEGMLNLNVNYFRFNLSKYDNNELDMKVYEICELKKKYPLKIMIDIPYPRGKPRIFFNNKTELVLSPDDYINISSKPSAPIYTDNAEILNLNVGDKIIYSDGEGILVVTDVNDEKIVARSEKRCLIYHRKSINFGKLTKNTQLNKYIKIINDIQPDSVALSFVISPKDVFEFKNELKDNVEIISKIETSAAVDSAEDIATYTSIMVGRGDLMIYADYRYLYEYQNRIMRAAIKKGNKVYVATGILSSLKNNSIPTQAELTDLARIIECSPAGIILNYGVVKNNMKVALDIINSLVEQQLKAEK